METSRGDESTAEGSSKKKSAVGKRSKIGRIRPATHQKDLMGSTSTAGEFHPIDEEQSEKTDYWDS